MPVTKEFKTFEQQIQGLEDRNLKFKNKKKSLEILQKYNYFDVINGFESILLKPDTSTKEYDDVYFEDFYDLYKFDMKLKNMMLFKVFDFESRLRTSIAYRFSSVYCSTISDTMNYTRPQCYLEPCSTDKHLTNKFKYFDLFRTSPTKDSFGRVKKEPFIISLKKDKNYVGKYNDPPFWVVIKSLPLGSLYYTFLFLDNEVKSLVLNDFGLSPSDSKIFEQSIYVLKEIRNQCAHLELVSRFKIQRTKNLNYFNNLILYAGLSKTSLNFMDVVKVLRIYGGVKDIKMLILKFYIGMTLKRRKKIADKIIGKMGKRNIISWIKL